jgi:hypothetical protein
MEHIDTCTPSISSTLNPIAPSYSIAEEVFQSLSRTSNAYEEFVERATQKLRPILMDAPAYPVDTKQSKEQEYPPYFHMLRDVNYTLSTNLSRLNELLDRVAL